MYVHSSRAAGDGLTRNVGGLPKNVTGTDGNNNSATKADIQNDSSLQPYLWGSFWQQSLLKCPGEVKYMITTSTLLKPVVICGRG
jgi:hypothetical protein